MGEKGDSLISGLAIDETKTQLEYQFPREDAKFSFG